MSRGQSAADMRARLERAAERPPPERVEEPAEQEEPEPARGAPVLRTFSTQLDEHLIHLIGVRRAVKREETRVFIARLVERQLKRDGITRDRFPLPKP